MYFVFVGDDGGVGNVTSMALSISRKNEQLRLFRGDAGVFGDSQPSVLMVLVGGQWWRDVASIVQVSLVIAFDHGERPSGDENNVDG